MITNPFWERALAPLLEAYDRFAKSASQGFILRAFFPWVFVAFINVVIYETLVLDGRSLIGWFAGQPENFQLYAALAMVMSIGAIAATCDHLAEFANARFRVGAKAKKNFLNKYFVTKKLCDLSGPGRIKPEAVMVLTLKRIEEWEDASHRSVTLVIGFGLSVWISAILLGRYHGPSIASIFVIISLAAAMLLAGLLARHQLATLAALDAFHRSLAIPAPKAPGTDKPPVSHD